MAGTGLDHSGISFKNSRSHSVSSLALFKAINSDSYCGTGYASLFEGFLRYRRASKSKYVSAG